MGIGAIKFKKIANHNILISTYRPTIYMATRGGTGMKNQVLVGYRVFKKIKYGSSRVWVYVKLCQKTHASVAK